MSASEFTKYACGEGYCGACTVMVSWFDRKAKKIRYEICITNAEIVILENTIKPCIL